MESVSMNFHLLCISRIISLFLCYSFFIAQCASSFDLVPFALYFELKLGT